MAAFLKKLEEVLRRRFPPPDDIEFDTEYGLLVSIISEKFKKMDPIDRINMIWDYLDENLSKKERGKIVLVLAMTPTEKILNSTR